MFLLFFIMSDQNPGTFKTMNIVRMQIWLIYRVYIVPRKFSYYDYIFQKNCHICMRSFCDKSTLDRHIRTIHLNERHICVVCGKSYSQLAYMNKHRREAHPQVIWLMCLQIIQLWLAVWTIVLFWFQIIINLWYFCPKYVLCSFQVWKFDG